MGRNLRYSRLLLKAVTLFLGAVAAIIVAIFISNTWYNNAYVRHFFETLSQYDETTSMEPAIIRLYSIDREHKRKETTLSIPRAYLDKKEYWEAGDFDIIHLKAEWHNMKPWTIASKTHREYDYQDGVSITLLEGYDGKTDVQQSVATYIHFLTDKGIAHDGYHYYAPKDLVENGSKKQQSEYKDILIPSDNNNDEARVIECINFKYGSSVGCHVNVFSTKVDLLIEYTFARKEFGHWREIDRNVLTFVESLKTDSKAQVE